MLWNLNSACKFTKALDEHQMHQWWIDQQYGQLADRLTCNKICSGHSFGQTGGNSTWRKKTERRLSYCLQYIKKWNSFSTSSWSGGVVTIEFLHCGCLQKRNFASTFTLENLSVSILSGKTPSLNCDKRFLTIKGRHKRV